MANRRDMAKVHARRRHTCPLCGKVVRGNGGRAAHRRMHIREAGLDEADFRGLSKLHTAHQLAWRAAYAKLAPQYADAKKERHD